MNYKLTTAMKRTLLLSVMAAASLWASVATAQNLSIYNVDASGFPKVSADYVLFDANGNPQTGFKATDFSVVERHTDGRGPTDRPGGWD